MLLSIDPNCWPNVELAWKHVIIGKERDMKEARTFYRLIPAQISVALSLQYAVRKESVNIPMSLLVAGGLDVDLLEKAVNLAVVRNDMFAMRLHKVRGRMMQYFDEPKIIGPNRLDFTGKTERAMFDSLTALGRKPIRHFNAPLGRVSIVTASNGDVGLFIVFSHLMADTWGCFVFLNDVFEVYKALLNRTDLPKAPASFEQCVKNELALADSDKVKKDYLYWREEFEGKPEPIFTCLQGGSVLQKRSKGKKRAIFGYSLNNHCTISDGYIPIDDVNRYLAFCHENNITLQAMYLAALRTIVSKACDRETDISFHTVLNHRPKLIDKQSGGCRVHFYPLRTIVTEERSFLELCQTVNDKLTSTYRHADADPVEIFNQTLKLCGTKVPYSYFGLSVTVQSIRPQVGGFPPMRFQWYNRGISGDFTYMIIMADNSESDTRIFFETRDSVTSPKLSAETTESIRRILNTGIENPSITVGELLNL